jgi:shikimate kinase
MLADLLGWVHLDMDAEIEAEQGITIPDIFSTRGEASFRKLEVDITSRLLARSEAVISTGGGWVTNAGVLDDLPPATLTGWLRAAPAEVARRLEAAGFSDRPLLPSGANREAAVRDLLVQRELLYARADLTIDTDGRDPADVAREIAATVREN